MHRIDTAGHQGNQFVDADPAQGIAGTVVNDEWLNSIQEEISNLVELSGYGLDKSKNNQVFVAVNKLIAELGRQRVIRVTTIDDLALVPAGFRVDGAAARIAATGRAGDFTFSSADLSSEVTADPLRGIYVAPDGETGSQGAWIRDISAGYVIPEMFGAVGDGIADDTAAVQGAIQHADDYGTLVFPGGLKSYKITAQLVQRQGQKWVFKGGQRASKLVKGYNGNVVQMSTLGRMISPFVDANGFSGTNILIKTGTFSQYLENVRTVGSSSPGILYETNAGGGSIIDGIEGDTTSPDTVGVIALTEDTSAVPRFWNNVYLSGGVLDIRGGGNGLSVDGFYIKDILTGYAGAVPTRSALYKFSNGRLADLGETSTVTAADGFYNNVAIASNVILDDCQGVKFTPTCTFTSITENPNSRFNSWFDQAKTFPTVWKASDGSLGDIGNGTLTMRQTRKGHFCRVVFEFIYGSTTTLPSGTGQWTFTLPFPGQQSITLNGVFANLYDSSGSNDSFAVGQVPADTATLGFGLNGQAVRNGFPFVWATGDKILCAFEYEVK